jgi:hypothetical protein
MKQELGIKGYLYLFFFLIKGFKISKKDNLLYLIDNKRWILISKIPKQSVLIFHFNRPLEFKNPSKKGWYKLGNLNPHVCLLLV